MPAPAWLQADPTATYAEVLEVDLDQIREPILACPNDPDDVKPLSHVAGTKIDEVFLGSCMTNIGHFRAATRLFAGEKPHPAVRLWLTPPTRMDRDELREEGLYFDFIRIGARTELPGCSLCMGNQARVAENTVVYSTSTRNFDNRLGTGSKVYLGSAELGAMVALSGKLPSVTEYLETYQQKIAPHAAAIYRYLQFDELPPKVYSA